MSSRNEHDSLAPAALDVTNAEAQRTPDALIDDSRWTPEAFARRARLAKYVGAAVAACALLAVVGGGVRYARRAAGDVVAARSPDAIAVTPAPAPAPPPPEAIATDPADPADPEGPAPSATTSSTDEPSEPEPSATDRELALRAKRYSHRALEIGHVAESIVAGERSVELDPTDREAWLVLGAAYQQRGRHDDARRCFQSCIKVGTRGETWQCSAMLR